MAPAARWGGQRALGHPAVYTRFSSLNFGPLEGKGRGPRTDTKSVKMSLRRKQGLSGQGDPGRRTPLTNLDLRRSLKAVVHFPHL